MMGLVLTAGGARGAYQAGVLKKLGEVPYLRDQPCPFPIIAGASAGAINGATLAVGNETFFEKTKRLAALWTNLTIQDVFKTDPLSLGLRSVKWLHDLSLGGLWGAHGVQSLLDFTPLRDYLMSHLSLDCMNDAIQSQSLYALAISATSYYSGKSYTFIHGQEGHPIWDKSRRIGVAARIRIDHVLASCAIPVVFQPILIESEFGDYYYGDGGLRLTHPLSPAIRLGADRVFAIGIRCQKSAELRLKSELLEERHGRYHMRPPPLAQVVGIALNAIFLDHLDADVEHLKRINNLLASSVVHEGAMLEPMKKVVPFVVNPSIDLAHVVQDHDEKMPGFVKYLLEGLGTSKAQHADLMSYLLFDSHYTKTLVEIGYRDAESQIDEILEFIHPKKVDL